MILGRIYNAMVIQTSSLIIEIVYLSRVVIMIFFKEPFPVIEEKFNFTVERVCA